MNISLTTTAWVVIILYCLVVLAAAMLAAAARKEWPFIPEKYESVAQYQSAMIVKALSNWLIGAPLLVARFIVGVAILRWMGWLH